MQVLLKRDDALGDFYRFVADRYTQRTGKSRELYERGKRVLPMGVSANGRWLDPYPMYIESAQGSRFSDVDGNEYIDYLPGAGALIFGHAFPPVVKAVRDTVGKFYSPNHANELEVRLAEKISQHIPCAERVRFINTGTEAMMSCFRIARAFTGRNLIMKFEGGYNGQFDPVLYSIRPPLDEAGPPSRPVPTAGTLGLPGADKNLVVIAPFNNLDATVALIEEHNDDLAAVVIEPVLGMGGGIAADKEFLQGLRDACDRFGVVLIFDEIVTGFRLSLNGAQGLYGITPDLATFGKIAGGGLPIGVITGKRQLMELVARPEDRSDDSTRRIKGRVFQSGTFSGNPLTMAAGLANITALEQDPGIYQRLEDSTQRLVTGLEKLFAAKGEIVQVSSTGSIWLLNFTDRPIRSIRDVMTGDMDKLIAFGLGMISEGIFVSQAHWAVTTAAHTDDDLDRTLNCAERIIDQMSQFGVF